MLVFVGMERAHEKRRSTIGLYDVRSRSIRIQNWGFCFLDPLGVWVLATGTNSVRSPIC